MLVIHYCLLDLAYVLHTVVCTITVTLYAYTLHTHVQCMYSMYTYTYMCAYCTYTAWYTVFPMQTRSCSAVAPWLHRVEGMVDWGCGGIQWAGKSPSEPLTCFGLSGTGPWCHARQRSSDISTLSTNSRGCDVTCKWRQNLPILPTHSVSSGGLWQKTHVWLYKSWWVETVYEIMAHFHLNLHHFVYVLYKLSSWALTIDMHVHTVLQLKQYCNCNNTGCWIVACAN